MRSYASLDLISKQSKIIFHSSPPFFSFIRFRFDVSLLSGVLYWKLLAGSGRYETRWKGGKSQINWSPSP